jgi:hypothetical protein
LALFLIPAIAVLICAKSLFFFFFIISPIFLISILGIIYRGITEYIEITEDEIKIKRMGSEEQRISFKELEIFRIVSQKINHGLSFYYNSFNIKIWEREFRGKDWMEICTILNNQIGLKSIEISYSD